MSEPKPVSEARVWDLQRAFYDGVTSEAFADVPHQAVDNPFVAAAYARVVVGFLRDCARGALDLTEPLYVVELGAGAGRFAHGFVRELAAWTDALPLALPPIVYVMTDLGDGTLDEWAANPALDDERLDFARFDVSADATLALRRRGVELDRLANPLVVIANYVFDSVPFDAFAVGDGELEELLLAVAGDDVPSMDLTWSRRAATPYGDPDLDALLEHYKDAFRDTVITVPRAGIECLRRLGALSGDRLLVLVGDKAHSTEASLAHRGPPELDRHGGSFSVMVNTHALGWYARRHGGEALTGGDRHVAVDVAALAFGDPPGGFAETRLAYADGIDRFSPQDHSFLTEGVERAAEKLGVAELVALLRLSGWDAFALLGVAGTLREQAAEADPSAQEDLREALHEIYARHFPLAGEEDLPFTIALLLAELEDYEGAVAYFERSLEQHGPDPATVRNLELCQAQLKA
ncbi:SAM-dependent methyltransferase [Solirubrobacter phytolaccae]|uniref:SAM-dependent methyltransferase n=1 Tax=Solirubrobacter phytolaccae TaxID=1404360 RepID=A0A9X3ND96_9ACTN|nr:SAM-dependent methyltransferase [Solirubrobacter phytolaccae]MDA0181931.1 SAM-dependent methyltransferase [Solirubrobacter phytolaccae]